MPIIEIEANILNKEQKNELITVLTKESARIMNLPENTITIIIHENNAENIGVGGTPLSELHKD